MKRTNLVLDEQILDEAKTISGLKTYSQVVNAALNEYVRRKKFERIDRFAGSDVWQGNLPLMRDDSDVSG